MQDLISHPQKSNLLDAGPVQDTAVSSRIITKKKTGGYYLYGGISVHDATIQIHPGSLFPVLALEPVTNSFER